MDQQRQSGKDQANEIPESLERELREFYLGIKQAFLYPMEHPVRTKAAGEIYRSLQRILSNQQNHSLTTIEDKLYINQYDIGADGQQYIASDEISIDLARKLRQRGIRSVVFSRDMELWELERFLNIMTMRPREVMDRGGAGKLLISNGDVPHIEIVDIEYEDVKFLAEEDKESFMDAEEILIKYLMGGTESLTDTAQAHLLSLIDEPELMARFIEECVGYDGIHEPDSTIVIQCIDKLISVGEELANTDEEKKDFREKLLEATLHMEPPVKNVLFSASDNDTLPRLMQGFSAGEIARFAAMECSTDEPSIPLRSIFGETLSARTSESGSFAGQAAEVEVAIQSELVEKKQEDLLDNTIIPILEEALVEFEAGRLERGQPVERLMDGLHLLEQEQETAGIADEVTALFAAEDEAANFAAILLEMLELETELESYSDIVGQLEGIVKSLVMNPEDIIDVQARHLTIVFQVVDFLFGHADSRSNKALEIQGRARRAVNNIGTEQFMNRVLLSSLKANHSLDWNELERFIQQMGKRAITPLIENLLDVRNPPERHKLGKILISMGPIVVPELRKRLSEGQWVVVVKDIIPILIEIGVTEALDCLSDALNHSNPQVRRSAISALAASNNPRAVELILSKIQDDDEEESIRQLALSVLGEMGNEQDVAEIERIIKGRNDTLKREAIHALSNIGGEKSISILSELLKQKRLILGRRRLEELQLQAVEVLSQIDTQSAMKVLLETSQNKKGKVKAACDAALQSKQQTSES